ncbi:unnamed protein product [Choristocarpus tenellus]
MPDIGTAATDLSDAVQSSLGAIGGFKGQVADSLEGAISGLKSQAGDVGTGALAPFQSLGESLSSGLRGGIEDLQSGFGQAATGAQTQLGDTLSETLGQPVQEALDQLLSTFGISKEEVLEDQQTVVNSLEQVVSSLERVATPRNCFLAENVAVLPLWLSMIFAPEKPITKAVMSSYATVLAAAVVYGWLAYESFQNPVSLAGFSSGITDLGSLTKGFGEEVSVATAWSHFLAEDLFIGRWVYLDGRKNKIFTGHSLALCYLFGPLGIISHVFTRGLYRVVKWDVKDIMESGVTPPKPTVTREAKDILAAAREQAASIVQEARVKGEAEASSILQTAETEALDILKGAEVERAALLKTNSSKTEATVEPNSATPSSSTVDATKASITPP